MSKISEKSSHLEICIFATLENVDRVSEETRKFLAAAGIENQVFEILLLLREALNNAVEHGSKCDPNKMVRYCVRLEQDELVMEIMDEGNGFDWRTCLGKEPGLDSDRGRGLALMRQYSLDVVFNEKGNGLILKKRID